MQRPGLEPAKTIPDKEVAVKLARENIIGSCVGHTAPLTHNTLNKHKGKMIIFDEFHDMVHDQYDSYGREALNVIITKASEQAKHFSFAFIGHRELMRTALESVPGLRRRVWEIQFSPYSTRELADIFLYHLLKQPSWSLTFTEEELYEFFATHNTFDNQGGDVEKLRVCCKMALAESWVPGTPKLITLDLLEKGYEKFRAGKPDEIANFMYS